MKYFGKKIILGGILLAVFIFVGGILSAPKDIYGEEPIKLENDPNNPTETSLSGYVLLEPLPGLINIENTGPSGFADYLNKIFAVVIGVAGLLAVLMLVINGIQYMMTDSVFQKGEAKSGIGNALLGLFLALGAFVILNTINPDLVNLNLRVEKVSIDINDMPMIVGPRGSALGDYIVGAPWPPTGTTPSENEARNKLSAAGITVTSSTNTICTEVGQPGCTSVAGLPVSVLDKIIKIKTDCGDGCVVTVTGGTEYWLHQTHGLGKSVVDFSVTAGLTKYITGKETFPADCKGYIKENVGTFVAEATPACIKWSPALHWHMF